MSLVFFIMKDYFHFPRPLAKDSLGRSDASRTQMCHLALHPDEYGTSVFQICGNPADCRARSSFFFCFCVCASTFSSASSLSKRVLSPHFHPSSPRIFFATRRWSPWMTPLRPPMTLQSCLPRVPRQRPPQIEPCSEENSC